MGDDNVIRPPFPRHLTINISEVVDPVLREITAEFGEATAKRSIARLLREAAATLEAEADALW